MADTNRWTSTRPTGADTERLLIDTVTEWADRHDIVNPPVVEAAIMVATQSRRAGESLNVAVSKAIDELVGPRSQLSGPWPPAAS